MKSTFDVIIVGLGAMGSAAAWRLASRGVRVLGLEQFGLVHAMGSSVGHTRMIRMAYFEHPDYVPLLRRAYELWDELEAQTSEKVTYRTGGIYMGPPEGEVVSGTLKAAQLHALAHETLSHNELRRRFAMFQLPEHFSGIWEPAAGFVLCERAIGLMCRRALESGAVLHGHQAVRQIDLQAGGVTVATDQGTYMAEKLLLCGGAWSGDLLADLNLQLVVTRQPLGWLWPQTPQTFALDRFPVWGIEQSDGSLAYGFPMLSELPGLKMARHGRGVVTDPRCVSRTPTESDQAEVLSIAQRFIPGAVGPMLGMKICLYTNSPDGHFIIDHHPASPRAHFAAGFSGHGFKFATVIGEVLADLALQGKTSLPVEFLGMKRFSPASGASPP